MQEGVTNAMRHAPGATAVRVRIDHGPGYRVYFMRRGVLLVLLLCGGDKSSQQKDIAQAKLIAEHFED